jgi:hypothetical protein
MTDDTFPLPITYFSFFVQLAADKTIIPKVAVLRQFSQYYFNEH